MGSLTRCIRLIFLLPTFLRKCSRVQDGIFSVLEVGRGLSTTLRDEFFTRIGPDKWEIKPVLREGLTTKKINLLEEWRHFRNFNLI